MATASNKNIIRHFQGDPNFSSDRMTQIELAGKINVSRSQYIRYETKDVQPPANIMNKLADVLGTSVDFLIRGDKSEKAKASLKNSELIQRFKEVDACPKKNRAC